MNDRLTDIEKVFAEKNHSLINRFLVSNDLTFDEWYGVVVFGYLKAVTDYHRKPSAKKYTFSACANRSMLDCVLKERRALCTDKRKLNWLADSFDVNISDDGRPTELYEIIADNKNDFKKLENNDFIKSICDRLTRLQAEIVKGIVNDDTPSEIQKDLHISRKKYFKEIMAIKEQLKGFFS